MSIPLVGLFAGAGGMIEGFHPARDPNSQFHLVLAIDKSPDACRTLWLRMVLRLLVQAGAADAYRKAVVSRSPEEHLRANRPAEAALADSIIWQAELGAEGNGTTKELHERIRKALKGADHWILVGGPPCQAFSRAGKARRRGDASYRIEDDPRVRLYRQYLDVLRVHRPTAFVLENVPDLLKTKLDGQLFRKELLEDLAGSGSIRWRLYGCCSGEIGPESAPEDLLVHADALGIPQARRRMIIVGIRQDMRGGLLPLRTVTDRTPAGAVLNGLAPLRSGVSRGRDGELAWREVLGKAVNADWLRDVGVMYGSQVVGVIKNAVAAAVEADLYRGETLMELPPGLATWQADWYGAGRWDLLLNHHSKEHMPEDLHRYLFAAGFGQVLGRSPKLSEFPAGLQPKHRNASSGKFPDRFRVQLRDRPSTTVTSHLSQDGHYFIHPDPAQCRSLTVREAARLQTFPDDYLFLGGKVSQYVQVGNAVPPLLARMVAQRALLVLDG